MTIAADGMAAVDAAVHRTVVVLVDAVGRAVAVPVEVVPAVAAAPAEVRAGRARLPEGLRTQEREEAAPPEGDAASAHSDLGKTLS